MGRPLLVVLVLLPAACTAPGEVSTTARAIVNGSPAPDSLAPAAGALVVDSPGAYNVFCSGTLVGERLVLTAAHCFDSLPAGTPVAFFAGLSIAPGDFSPPLSPVDSVHKAPGYGGGTAPTWIDNYNDLALVKLTLQPAVQPMRLVRPAEVDPLVRTGGGVMLLGMGQTEAGVKTSTGTLHHGAAFIGEVGTHEFHVQGDGDPQKCHGDSGGPTLGDLDSGPGYDFRLIGITSRADTACTAGSIETRVDAHLSWIHQVGGQAIPCGSGLAPDCPPAPEAGAPDSTLPDDAAAGEAGTVGFAGGGGCAVTGTPPAPLPLLLLLLLVAGRHLRR